MESNKDKIHNLAEISLFNKMIGWIGIKNYDILASRFKKGFEFENDTNIEVVEKIFPLIRIANRYDNLKLKTIGFINDLSKDPYSISFKIRHFTPDYTSIVIDLISGIQDFIHYNDPRPIDLISIFINENKNIINSTEIDMTILNRAVKSGEFNQLFKTLINGDNKGFGNFYTTSLIMFGNYLYEGSQEKFLDEKAEVLQREFFAKNYEMIDPILDMGNLAKKLYSSLFTKIYDYFTFIAFENQNIRKKYLLIIYNRISWEDSNQIDHLGILLEVKDAIEGFPLSNTIKDSLNYFPKNFNSSFTAIYENKRAWKLYEKGKYEEALKIARMVVKACPNSGACRDTLACILLTMGNIEESFWEFKRAVADAKGINEITIGKLKDLIKKLGKIELIYKEIESIEELQTLFPKSIEELRNTLPKSVKVHGKEIDIKNNTLDLSKLKIKDILDIKDLNYLTSLQQLWLDGNQITEIKGLNELTNLEVLFLNGNQITMIDGLDNLSHLKILNLDRNQITEIKGLDKLLNLKELRLIGNQITEIKGLDKLINLQELWLPENQITEIKGLDKLLNLQDLWLHGNQITEIKNLDKLNNLKQISLYDNKILENESKCIVNGISKLKELSCKKRVLKNLVKILQIEKQNQKIITKKEMIKDIGLEIEEISYYNDLLQLKMHYDVKELIVIKEIAQKIMTQIENPTLSELVVTFGLDFYTAKKVGQYLLDQGIINKFPRILMDEKASIEISRGFEVAGDAFKFFIRVENPAEFAYNNVKVNIEIPNTMKFDIKTESNIIDLGILKPSKFKTAIYYLYCTTCADEEINAFISYNDGKGILQMQKMAPFQIKTCKWVRPRDISYQIFQEKLEKEDKKTIEIQLKEGISEELVKKLIRDRITMSTISSDTNILEMFGVTKEGTDIGIQSVIKEIQGIKTLFATVFSENHQVQMGVLSDVMELAKNIKKDTSEIRKDLRELIEKLDIQMDQYTSIIDAVQDKRNVIRKLNDNKLDLEMTGESEKATKIGRQITQLSNEVKTLFKQSEKMLNDISSGILDVISQQSLTEEWLRKELESDWDKIKNSWNQYKEGTINKNELIKRGLKGLGKKFLNKLTDLGKNALGLQ